MTKVYTFTCDPNECDSRIDFYANDEFDFPNGAVAIRCACGRPMNWISVDSTGTNQIDALHSQVDRQSKMIEQLQDQITRQSEDINRANTKIANVISNLTSDGWYSRDIEKSDVLTDLCEVLGHEPKHTIRFTARMTVDGEIDVPIEEAEDFDLDSYLEDVLTVDSYNGDVEILKWDIEYADQE